MDRILDTCICGGVEILGLHATVAPRRQLAQDPPIKESFSFVPYTETMVDTELQQYLQSCKFSLLTSLKKFLSNGLADKVKNVALFKAEIQKAECEPCEVQYVPDADCTLMQLLKNISDVEQTGDCMTNLENLIKSRADDLRSDKLLSSLLNARHLKSCIDVAIENLQSLKLKMYELDTADQLFRRIVPHVQSQPLLNADYFVAGPNVDTLDEKLLENHSSQKVKWEFRDSLAPGNLMNSDIIVASNGVHQTPNISDALMKITKSLKTGGFAVIREVTKNFVIPLMLEGLTKEFVCTDKEERTFGPFCDETTWMNHFRNAGLEVVSRKSDAIFNTIFLCRKCSDDGSSAAAATPYETIDVSDFDCSWVDSVKTAMEKHFSSASSEKIWLVAKNVPHSGIVGMVNCLRKEPGGDRIRLVNILHIFTVDNILCSEVHYKFT